jgi:hypothetical protein
MSKFLSGRSTRFAVLLAALVAIICAAYPVSRLFAAPAAPQSGPNSVYLPMMASSGSSTTPPPTTTPPTTTPPPAGDDGALFMQPEKKVAGPSLKVDAQGGMHMAYYDSVPLADKPAATYAYCPPPAAQCGDGSKWSYLSMGDAVDQAQLALTPEGHPRMLVGLHNTAAFEEWLFYGECNSNCAVSGDNWTFVQVATQSLNAVSISDSERPRRSFALDAQGHPGFVYYDKDYVNKEPDHTGGYYYSCQTNCTDAANWSEAHFTRTSGYYDELIDAPVLQYTSDGKPRVLSVLYPLNETGAPYGLYYFTCDTGCATASAWERTMIDERTSGPYPAWDLELDAQNNPRVTYFKYDDGSSNRTLWYEWCNSACANGANWHKTGIGVPGEEGIGADLALDAAGHPRIAYLSDENLGYAWCDGDCTSAAGWQHGYADNDQRMEEEYPIARPVTCNAGIWDSYSPSFALDRAGNPRIAYDASYKAYCQYQDPTDPTRPPTNEFHEIWHSVRMIFTTQP